MATPIPYNSDAEQAVLASVLLEPDALYGIDLEPREFFNETNARIFGLMREISAEGGTPDLVTLASRAQDAGKGASYLAGLLHSLPTAALIGQYADAVREARLKRDLLQASTEIAELALSDTPAADLVPRAQSRLQRITTPEKGVLIPIQEALADYMPAFEQMLDEPRAVWGIPTALDLDKYTGGLIGGDEWIIAGRPGKGKTSLAMQTAFEVAQRGYGVVVFSLEMARRQYMLRLLSTLGNVNAEDIKRGKLRRSDDGYRRIREEALALSQSNLWIVDTSQSTDSVRAHLARLKQQHPLHFVVIDYLDMLTDRIERDEQRVKYVARSCKRMARDFDVCLWLLHAVNRQSELNLQSLMYGGDYDADVAVLCHFPDDRKDVSAELILAKNRNGDTCKLPMIYRGAVTRWDNPAKP